MNTLAPVSQNPRTCYLYIPFMLKHWKNKSLEFAVYYETGSVGGYSEKSGVDCSFINSSKFFHLLSKSVTIYLTYKRQQDLFYTS